jgi:hypothetical protein
MRAPHYAATLHLDRDARARTFAERVAFNARGAGIVVCSTSWTNRQAVGFFRTSCGVSDLPTLFCRPTAAHLAPFYLAIVRSAVGSLLPAVPARPFAKLRSDKKRTKHPPDADSAQVHCSRYPESLVAERASHVTRSSETRTQELRWLCALCADRTPGRRQADD